MVTQTTENPSIPALTGIRFFFALCVVLLHAHLYANWLDFAPVFRDGFVLSGGAGVNFFFILSGFILTYSMAPIAGNKTDEINIGRFYLARFARIYPVYIFGLIALLIMVLTAPLKVIVMPDGLWDRIFSFTAHVTVLQGWIPELALHWNPPGWSLTAEIFFYALFPLLAPFILNRGTRWLIAAGVLCYGLSLGIPLLCHALGLVNMHNPDDGTAFIDKNLYFYFPLIRLPEFVLGIVLAGLFLKNTDFFKQHAPVFLWLGMLGMLAGLQLGLALIPYLLLNNGALGIFAACVIIGLCGTKKSALSDLMSSKIMVQLGNASYALYVLHYPVLFLFVAFMPADLHPVLALCLYLPFITILSVWIYHFYERPMRRLILTRLSGQDAPKPVFP